VGIRLARSPAGTCGAPSRHGAGTGAPRAPSDGRRWAEKYELGEAKTGDVVYYHSRCGTVREWLQRFNEVKPKHSEYGGEWWWDEQEPQPTPDWIGPGFPPAVAP
jgi:hypothetical protein